MKIYLHKKEVLRISLEMG